MRIQEIDENEVCKSCNGLRKVFNPFKKQFEPCQNCEGDGSFAGLVDVNKVNTLFKQQSEEYPSITEKAKTEEEKQKIEKENGQ